MRSAPVFLSCCLAFLLGAVAHAGDAKKPYLDKQDSLTDKDEFDTHPRLAKSHRKVHEIDLQAGKVYRIDMTSTDLDALLRLEDPDGKMVAIDDDSGGNLNARIIYKAKRTATYKIIATTFKPGTTGAYQVVVRDPEPRDLLTAKVAEMQTQSASQKLATVREVVAHFDKEAKNLAAADSQLVFPIIMALDQLPKKDGLEMAKKLGGTLAASEIPQLKSMSGMFAGISRRLDLPGKEMSLKGTKLDGEPLDWKSYRGKLVLVDFWATWCGPCVVEMPRLKKLYEANREKGFEIVGISLDRNVQAPTDFMKKKGYDWVCLFEKDQQRQPLPEYYGIFAIPSTMLVGRDGKVIALNLRGEELERAIEANIEKK